MTLRDRIDEQDDIYHELKIWQDKDQNGVCSESEVKSLSNYGISLNLDFEKVFSIEHESMIPLKFTFNVKSYDANGNLFTTSGFTAVEALLAVK